MARFDWPDDPAQALAIREQVYFLTDRQAQADIRALCATDYITWLRLFGWTFLVKEVLPDGNEVPVPTERANVPFYPWPAQVEAADTAIECIRTGHDAVCEKSREQGASWLLLVGLATWGWLHHGWQSLLCSRTEDLVDRTGDPDSLFWKVDYMLQALPGWYLPCPHDELRKGGNHRTHMMLRHPSGVGTISGVATTDSIGVGGRRTFIGYDEMSRMPDGAASWRAASSTTSCRLAVSTHVGVGTEFERLCLQSKATGDPRHISLLYHQHPTQGLGAEERVDSDGTVTGLKGERYIWTPWLERQSRRRDRVDMAQNIFARPVGSGYAFFHHGAVSEHRTKFTKVPERCILTSQGLTPSPSGPWLVFERPTDPSRRGGWCIGIDPAYGTGNHISAAVVLDTSPNDRPRVVAMLTDPHIQPAELASVLSHCGKRIWVDSLMAWETNGPGETLARDFEAQGYRHLWCARKEGAVHDAPGITYGWRSNDGAKRKLLGELSRAMQQGELVCPDSTTLDEMLGYQLDEHGRVIPGRLRDETSGARENHGDRVIALALAMMAAPDTLPATLAPQEYAPGTWGAALDHAAALRKLREQDAPPDPFNF